MIPAVIVADVEIAPRCFQVTDHQMIRFDNSKPEMKLQLVVDLMKITS